MTPPAEVRYRVTRVELDEDARAWSSQEEFTDEREAVAVYNTTTLTHTWGIVTLSRYPIWRQNDGTLRPGRSPQELRQREIGQRQPVAHSLEVGRVAARSGRWVARWDVGDRDHAEAWAGGEG